MKPKARVKEIVVQRSGKEILIYDLSDNKAFCLNESSSRVFEMCDGNRTVDQIAIVLNSKSNTLITKEFVLLALSQMVENGLIEESRGEYLKDASRRNVIRRLGVATLAVLPTISLVTAPRAAAAQSCLADGTAILIPFPNPSTQPDAAACQANCFQPPNPANPDATCCSGIARSGASTFAGGLNRCTCLNYQCVAS